MLFSSFYRSEIDYAAKNELELSFKVGDKLVVVNTFVQTEKTDQCMWMAKKMGADGDLLHGLIPKLRYCE